MNDNVKGIFNLVAEEYDKERRELIPLFDVYYGTAVQILNLENTKGKIHRLPIRQMFNKHIVW